MRFGRLVLGATLAAFVATAGAAHAFIPARSLNHKHHLSHLQKATNHLKAAETALTSNNPARSAVQVTDAISQIQAAMNHHKTNYLTVRRTGFGGLALTVAHHNHHGHLHHALTNLRSAEGALAIGQQASAMRHIDAAGVHVVTAIRSHHGLIGR